MPVPVAQPDAKQIHCRYCCRWVSRKTERKLCTILLGNDRCRYPVFFFLNLSSEKALAATGCRSVQIASDWLLARVNDPRLDEYGRREYAVYLCPTGPLGDQLRDFWEKSATLCGRNGAHASPPHVTIVPFFQAPDERALELGKLLERAAEDHTKLRVQLETYMSTNFMGFFLNDECSSVLKQVAGRFIEELSLLCKLFQNFW